MLLNMILFLTIHLDFGTEKTAKMLVLLTATLTKMVKSGLLESRGRSTRRSSSSHGLNVKILMYGVQTLYKLYVLHREILTRLHGEDGWLLLNFLILTMLNSLTQVNSASSRLTPSCPLPCRIWWMLLVKRHSRSRCGLDREVKYLVKKGTS